jgi:hypothetical protein
MKPTEHEAVGPDRVHLVQAFALDDLLGSAAALVGLRSFPSSSGRHSLRESGVIPIRAILAPSLIICSGSKPR